MPSNNKTLTKTSHKIIKGLDFDCLGLDIGNDMGKMGGQFLTLHVLYEIEGYSSWSYSRRKLRSHYLVTHIFAGTRVMETGAYVIEVDIIY